MREIELELEKNYTRIVEHFEIELILKNLGYSRINDKIVQLIKKQVLTPLKKGLYLYNPLHNHIPYSKELIANKLISPSYVSMEWALSYHNIIPEMVHTITSMCFVRSKEFHTPIGVFSYTHIAKELFPIGLSMRNDGKIHYIIASKEKALCDKVFFTKGFEIKSKKAMMVFLEDDLRVDLDEFKDADVEIFKEYFRISKSHKIGILLKIIEEIKNEH